MKTHQIAPDSLKYLDRAGIAGALGLNARTVDRLRKRGILPYIKLSKKLVLFDPSAVKAALDKYAVSAGRN